MKITLDAGHGYKTIGKQTPDGMKEYEFNRAVAQYMKENFEQYEGVTVYFAHDDSRDVPLAERTNQANKLGVDLYFSIHANAFGSGWNDANGIETFAWVHNNAESLKLANAVQANLVKATGLKNRGVKTADYHVLRETNMPAILVEHAFMTNTAEAEKLKSEDFRKICAESNVQAIANVYGLKRKPKKVKTVHIYTGGYGGEALATVQAFIASNKWWYQPSRNPDGTVSFLVGGFAEGSDADLKLQAFLKERNWWFEKR
jgi:N-acetylmuramoyl-L-alanine amidase